MTAKQFRSAALRLPEAVEGSHMGHADFRVRGKIFATLGPEEDRAMVKLPLDVQAALVEAHPANCELARGAWGAQGATILRLAGIDSQVVRQALRAAWRRTAPKRLASTLPAD